MTGITQIGSIYNYYGFLGVREDDGKFYWGIDDHDGDWHWEEIPEYLYKNLIKFNDSIKAKVESEQS